jgi:hypothetical protein
MFGRRSAQREIIVEQMDPLMRFGPYGAYLERCRYPFRPWDYERDGWR